MVFKTYFNRLVKKS